MHRFDCTEEGTYVFPTCSACSFAYTTFPSPALRPRLQDTIPDEAFRRLRGALFFGPAFRVTRNKLLFRDNLGEALAAAVPGERQMEAKFRQWLQRCHATLDKSVRFEALADSRTQVGGVC